MAWSHLFLSHKIRVVRFADFDRNISDPIQAARDKVSAGKDEQGHIEPAFAIAALVCNAVQTKGFEGFG